VTDGPGDATLLVPLTLVIGPEELLVARAVRQVTAAARARDAEADIRELVGDAVELGLLLDLATPSMFGGDRVVVIRDAQDLAEDVREALVAYVAAPSARRRARHRALRGRGRASGSSTP